MQPLPRNARVLIERPEEIQRPLEAWQEEFLREQELIRLGFTDSNEWVPMNLSSIEDEDAWKDEKPIMRKGADGRPEFCGQRFVGEAFDPARADHRAADANEVDGNAFHPDWDDNGR